MGIEFNHLYVTLDSETIEAIANSAFICQDFCTVSRDTVETDQERWSGVYLRGKYAYLELFAPGGAEGFREGFSGLAFSTQQAGELGLVEKKLESLTAQTTAQTTTQTTAQTTVAQEILSSFQVRQVENQKVPWFYYLAIKKLERIAFSPWLMEFHQDYLDYKKIKPTNLGWFDRSAYLKNLDTSETALFKDVSEVHLELTSSEHKELALLLEAIGYQGSTPGKTITYRSPGFTVHVAEVVDPMYRIRKVVCTLMDQPHQETTLTFGQNATLTVGKDLATWEFG